MSSDLIKSLSLMSLGMVGIFVVIILIYVVIFLLNKLTADKKNTETISQENESNDPTPTEDNSEDEELCAIVEAVMCEELHVGPDEVRIIKITAK